ncbi:MAG: T9SS type A sorting domain-containing protein [Prolixibacteraceae bacterium]|nr:T9SS type A sorting domain-containing protein [Prolixibacteraceae bacterium]
MMLSKNEGGKIHKIKAVNYSVIIGNLILLFFMFINETTAQTLYINEISGNQSDIGLSTIQKLTFSNGDLNVIRKSESPMDFQLTEIRHLIFVDSNSGMEFHMNQKQGELVVFPNPVDNKLNVRFNSLIKEPCELKIITIDGRKIFTEKFSLSEGKKKHQLDVSHLKKGLYFCHIKNNNFSTTKQFIKK